MTDLKISQLTDGGGLQADDEIAVNRGSSSKKARGVGTDGWISDTSESWTFNSFTAGPPAVGTFKVPGDLRTKYTVGTRIKLTQTTVRYFVVTADPTYDGTNTTVTISGGTDFTLANAAISANYHSYDANPQGYPSWFNFNGAATGFSGSPTVGVSRFEVIDRVCNIQFEVQGTSNATTLTFTLPIAAKQLTAGLGIGKDSGVSLTTPERIVVTAGSSTATVGKDCAGNAFTNSGTKEVRTQGTLLYEV